MPSTSTPVRIMRPATVRSVAFGVGCSEPTIRRLLREGTIRHVKFLNKALLEEEDVESWLSSAGFDVEWIDAA